MRLTTTISIRVPSPPVFLVALLLVLLGITFGFRNLGQFLSPSEPIGRGALLIEGWVSREQFGEAIELYKRGGYSSLLTTGGPYFLDCDRDDATYVAQVARLARENGLSPGELQVVRIPRVTTDRTHAAAVATASWPQIHLSQTVSVDVVSPGPHARRSWLAYRTMLEPMGIEVGVLSANPGYEIGEWWRSSEGVKAVVSEFAGWLWEAFFAGTERGGPRKAN